jgi:hypothetical protein
VNRSDVTENMHTSGTFDRFAARASDFVSEAVFFLGCVLLVVVWLPGYFVFRQAPERHARARTAVGLEKPT